MCGIAGIYVTPASAFADIEDVALRMARTLLHRGPDSIAAWSDRNQVAFGHTRLAIIDLSDAGSQPMSSRSGLWTVTYNGEIYNADELRRGLARTGATLRGHSDTEVLVEALDRWGIQNTLERVDGMFAFGAWEHTRRVLHLARDRFGEKPLYYSQQGSAVVFGSELRALRVWPGFSDSPDVSAIDALVRYGYIPSPWTVYDGVNKLPPGCRLEVADSRGTPSVIQWWDAAGVAIDSLEQATPCSIGEAADKLDELLRTSVSRRLVADVPLGALLSGGVDSSLVVATAARLSELPVRTYSIGFDDETYNEAPFAKSIADYLGTEHHEHIVTQKEALSVVPQLPTLWDEPFGDSSQIPTYLVAGYAAKDVKVALSGDGADELFGGYDRYRHFARFRRARSAAHRPALRSLSRYSSAALMRAPTVAQGEWWRRARYLAAILSSDSDTSIYRLLMDQWCLDGSSGAIDILSTWPSDRYPVGLSPLLVDTLTYLPDDVLTKVDRATMAHSLEARAPFLTGAMYEFAWSLPGSMRWDSANGKPVLRELLGRYLPLELFDRPKQGFGIPIHRWLREDLRDWGSDLLENPVFRNGLLPMAPDIVDAWRAMQTHGAKNGHRVWPALMFEAWRRHHHPEW